LLTIENIWLARLINRQVRRASLTWLFVFASNWLRHWRLTVRGHCLQSADLASGTQCEYPRLHASNQMLSPKRRRGLDSDRMYR